MMQFSPRRATGFVLIAAAGLVAAGCGGGGGEEGLKGTISADGSSTVFPITQAVAEEFRAEAPGVEVSVGTSGTGGGFERFCRGESDISNASRPIAEEEAKACKKAGIEYVELTVATDGLSVVVNPENDFVSCLTTEQLKKIWQPGSKVTTWRDVDPGWPAEEITLYGPGTDSGTFDYFTDEVVGEEGASRSDYTASEDDNVLVQGVSGDEGALGYFGYGYYTENQDKLKLVEVDGGDGCVAPSEETINAGEYTPLSRPLYLYVARKAAQRDEVAQFVDFYLETASDLVGDIGYIPADESVMEESRGEWESFSKQA